MIPSALDGDRAMDDQEKKGPMGLDDPDIPKGRSVELRADLGTAAT